MKLSLPLHCLVALLLVLAMQACKSRQLAHLEQSIRERRAVPPNGVRIQENLFVDETEACNLDYREYMHWLVYVHGLNSPQHLAALPDTLVWKDSFPASFSPLAETYFRNPVYDVYPVVGLSLEQAKGYTDWRTDRVYEMILMRLGKIKLNPYQNSDNYFTVKRYQSGQYMGYVPDRSVLVPRYRLPTEAEWELAASAGLDIYQHPQGYNFDSDRMKKVAKRYPDRVLKTREAQVQNPLLGEEADMPSSTRGFTPNDFGLYHMIGNVAEMTHLPGLAKGGHYLLPAEKCTVAGKVAYDKPTKWLGFRNVCSWEKD